MKYDGNNYDDDIYENNQQNYSKWSTDYSKLDELRHIVNFFVSFSNFFELFDSASEDD